MAEGYEPQATVGFFTSAKLFISTEKILRDGKPVHVPCLNQQTLEELKKISEPLVVVSAIGPYRSGKSYVLNRLARKAKSDMKFQVGHSSEPETKGLWVMVMNHPTRLNHKLVLIDTEGVGDTTKGDMQHDASIFTLTSLLSSTMIYNGKSAIDEDTFEKLSFTAEMSKHVVSKTNGDDFHDILPEMLYVVRDFTLELKSKGTDITPDEYFEMALVVKDGEEGTTRSKVRNCIKKYFQRRKCFTLDIPAAGKKAIGQLDIIADEDLNPDFVADADRLCTYIVIEGQAKALQNGRGMNGRQLATLAEIYVNAYREGKVPNVASAMDNLKKTENTKVVKCLLDSYVVAMGVFQQQQMPTETRDDVVGVHEDLSEELIKQAQKDAILDENEVDQFVNGIKAEFDGKIKHFLQENERLSSEKCKATLRELLQKVIGKDYHRPGGYSEYVADRLDLENQYQAKEGLGVEKERIWLDFVENEKGDERKIMNVDKILTEKEKEVIAKRQETEQARLEKENMAIEMARMEAEAKENRERLERNVDLEKTVQLMKKEERENRHKMDMELKQLSEKYDESRSNTQKNEWILKELQRKENDGTVAILGAATLRVIEATLPQLVKLLGVHLYGKLITGAVNKPELAATILCELLKNIPSK